MIEGISHVTYLVKDLERSSGLLKTLLGAEEVYSSGDNIYSVSREKFFRVGGLWLALMEGESETQRNYEHLAFKIAPSEFKAYQSKILSLGLEIKPPRSRVDGEGSSLYFYDYDGHLFELHTGTLEERLRAYASSAVTTIRKTLVFRGTEAYHYTDYFKKQGVFSPETERYLLDQVAIEVITLEPHLIGSLSITQVEVSLTGESLAVDLLTDKLKLMFMTAGG